MSTPIVHITGVMDGGTGLFFFSLILFDFGKLILTLSAVQQLPRLDAQHVFVPLVATE